jgi:hypothetical protein
MKLTRTPKGTQHVPLMRRLLSGRLVPREHEGVRPQSAGGAYVRQPGAGARRAAALFADVPAPTRVLVKVAGPVLGQPRRRDRRAAVRKASRPQETGGGYCPCSGLTRFYGDEDRERWDEMHAYCDEDEVPA